MGDTEDTALQVAGDDSVGIVELPHGRGLTAQEAEVITRHSFSRVLYFAGNANSGKTTLLSAVYLLFQKGPFQGFRFAGSKTLVGFEQRTHLARVSSAQAQPLTLRTTRTELLHLRLEHIATEQTTDVLMCDLPGEDFRDARDSTDACAQLPAIRRVDHLVLLIDGAKIASLATRQQAKGDPHTLLRNMLDNKILSGRATVDVIFTKWDELVGSSDAKEAQLFADHVEALFQGDFSSRVPSLRIARVAAHSPSPNFDLGYGLGPLFSRWVGESQHATPTPRPPSSKQGVRFDCFTADAAWTSR